MRVPPGVAVNVRPIPSVKVARPHASKGAADERHHGQLRAHLLAGHELIELEIVEDDSGSGVDLGALRHTDAKGRILLDDFVTPQLRKNARNVVLQMDDALPYSQRSDRTLSRSIAHSPRDARRAGGA